MQHEVEYTVQYKEAGVQHSFNELYSSAWAECEESHIMDRPNFVKRGQDSVSSIARYELVALVGDRVVGAMVVAEEGDDPHVGDCLSVVYNYVLPEYRSIGIGRHFFRAAIRLAESLGHHTLAYTHRVGAGKYLTTYRKVHG